MMILFFTLTKNSLDFGAFPDGEVTELAPLAEGLPEQLPIVG